jgi:hypothetical protein
MLTQNYQPTQSIFNCKLCDYKCSDKSNFNKHLHTSKHKTNANTNTTTTTTTATTINECKCGKKYRHSASLSRHKSTCKKNDSNETIILGLIAQNKELMTLLSCQQQQHKEETQCLFKTIQDQSVNMQQTIKEIIPSIGNNNTTNNNQFNLQVFLNEDCKDALNFSEFLEQIQVSFEDLENQAKNGYIKGISKLFIESLQELGQNKRPIHCSDKKRKTIYIKEDNEWDKEGSLDILKKGINEVTKRTVQTLMKEKENNAEEYKDMDSEFSMKCLEIQRNLFPITDREATIGKVIEKITQSSGIL